MEIDADSVLAFLAEKKVTSLYHANSVQTSCTFLQQARLLSRGTLDERGLSQTPQQTDATDKQFGLWFDLFLDSVDTHVRARKRSVYGPVTFQLSAQLLASDWNTSLWITKCNPQYWTPTTPQSDRYFSSLKELRTSFVVGRFDHMLVLRHVGGVLRLAPFLEAVTIDSVMGVDDTLHQQSIQKLQTSAQMGEITTSITHRNNCRSNCVCLQQYRDMQPTTRQKFFA